jgi:predicted phage terminase large subunit-like protein
MLTETEELEYLALLEEREQDAVRASHLEFMQHLWIRENPMVVGFHTRKICERIDRAIEDFRNGKSSYILINVHHRAGKSDIVSRYLGAHFLGEFPDQEVMQVSYQANLAIGFSAFGRNLCRSEKFTKLYPNVLLSKETNKKNEWVIADSTGKETGGKLYASGLLSGLTGQGYALGILDDYLKGRSAAESLVQRDNCWDCFTNDFLTRMAPVHIVLILATIWHWDDVSGRIEKAMKEDPDFPKFEIMRFPARAKNYTGEGRYPGEYLFLERYPESWYRSQYATLGKYAGSALLDCDPLLRGGGRLSTVGIVYEDEMPNKDGVPMFPLARVWDLAHTKKQRSKEDPDWTSGTKLAFERRAGDPVLHLWVADVVRTREGALQRDNRIKQAAETDTAYCQQAVEISLDAGDAFEYLRAAMPQIAWKQVHTTGDKSARATPLEPIFETPGHVHVIKGAWNDDWVDEVLRFDGSGKQHDDQIDNLSAGYILMAKTVSFTTNIGSLGL